MKNTEIAVQGKIVRIVQQMNTDFISLTDIAKYKDPERSDYVLQNWLRNRNTIDFIGLWEKLHNPDFNSIEFDGFRLLVSNKYVFCVFLSMMIDGPMTHQELNHYVNLFRLASGFWRLELSGEAGLEIRLV
jgi:hypothetical protein